MRHGEALGIRWDIAFFQMIFETGALRFGGDVRPCQNNFAGLGASGGGAHGESFGDVSTGVKAHLQHLLMYSGEHIDDPAIRTGAERYRQGTYCYLIIRGAEICDGTGAPRRSGDIAIADGRIAEVGACRGTARREIDADGLVAAPGFIDVHTHYDCQVSWDPALTPSCWHGVTTVVMGNCGFTIAPCRPAHRELLMEMLLYVEGMPTEALRAGIRWEWETFPEYLDAVERWRPAINVAAFVGHSAMRYFVMGDAAVERAATDDELARMQDVVREAMRAGAVGFSTSESPTHFFGNGTPVPSRVAPRDEIVALAACCGEFGRGIIEVAPLHLIGAHRRQARRPGVLRRARARGAAGR